MEWLVLRNVLTSIQHLISFLGVFIILVGVVRSLCQYLYFVFSAGLAEQTTIINTIRLSLGRVLILGLEFIVAADLIGTTTTPDYYAVGLLAIIVLIRTFLSFSLNRELMAVSKDE